MNFKQWLESVGIVNSVPDALQTLGIRPGASEEEVKRAFRMQSMRHHTDLGGSNEAQKRINAAFDLLKSKGFQTSSQEREPAQTSSQEREPAPEQPSRTGQRNPHSKGWGWGFRHTYKPQRSDNDLPPWQTDERSSYNEVGSSRKNKNYCLKEIYEKAMENGGNVKKYTFEAFDGKYFRGIFTAYCNPRTLGFAGEVMEDWNSKGANPYETYAVFASRNNKLILLRLRGEDVAEANIVWGDFTNEDRNSQYWRDQLRKDLDSLSI